MYIRKVARLVCVFCTVCCQTGGHALCPVGFMPPDCQEQCKSGLFGVNCASICPATCIGRACKPDTGFCYSCHDGFTGPKCSLKCRSGFFGQDCKIPCPLNCLKSVCDPFTGFCERCLKGYTGVKCERRSVLRDSSVQSAIIDDSDVDNPARKTSKNILVYILVVVMACLLPACAVSICVHCAKKHSSRRTELETNPVTTSHIPVSKTPPRRPGRLALKYEQLQTIEEESSNQFTLEDDVHREDALNPAPASVTTLHTHQSVCTPSQRQTCEISQASTVDPAKYAPDTDSPYNYQQQYLLNDDGDRSFDFRQTPMGIQGFGVYKPQNICITPQSNPTTNFGSDFVTNTMSTDLRIQNSAQAGCFENGQFLYERTSVPYLDRAGVHTVFYTETAGCVSPINPQITPATIRSECSSSFQERVPAHGYTHEPVTNELWWQQAQAIRQADNPHGDMASLDSPSDIGDTNQDKTAAEALTVPNVGQKIPGYSDPTKPVGQQIQPDPIQPVCQQVHPDPTQPLCQQINQDSTQGMCLQVPPDPTQGMCQQIQHSNGNDADNVNTIAELQKSKMANVAVETKTPYVHKEMYTSNECGVNLHSQSAASLSERQAARILPLFRLEYDSLNDVSQPQKTDTCVVAPACPGDRNRTPTKQHQNSREVNQGNRSHVDPAELQQTDILVASTETEPNCSPVSAAGFVKIVSASRQIRNDVSTAVSIPASTAVSIPASTAVSIPIDAAVSNPHYSAVTAVLHRCQVRGEDEILVGGDAVDTTCKHIHTMDYTQLTVRHAFDRTTDGRNVFQDPSSPDFVAEEGNVQTRQVSDGHTDQTSGDVCKQTGQFIFSSTDNVPSAERFPVNGSANNINRLHVLTRQPPSSSTTTSSTPAHRVRQTSCLYLESKEQVKQSVLTDTVISETSMPLFSICSSAPMKLSVTYCKNGFDEDKPVCMYQAPRYFSMSSLGNTDECPGRSREPLQLSVQLTSPPKNREKKCHKGKDPGECRYNLPHEIFLGSARPDISHHRKSSAIKCDQFRQVVYTKETPCRHRTTPQYHLSVATGSKITSGRRTQCETVSSVLHERPENKSDASNSTCTFDPISRTLDENPIRHDVVPETRNLESLTPVSAIKMSVRQAVDGDILTLHTSDRAAEMLLTTRTGDQGHQQDGLASVIKPLTGYNDKSSSMNRYTLHCEPCQDIPNSSWSGNTHLSLAQEQVCDGYVRSRRSDEVSHTVNFPKSTHPQAGAVPVDSTTNFAQLLVSTSDITHQATSIDNRPGTEPSPSTCKHPLTVSGYCPQLLVLGSGQNSSSTATINSMYPVVSDDSLVAMMSASDRSKASLPTTSVQGLNTGGHQIFAQMLPTQVTFPGNKAITGDRHQSDTPGHNLPPYTYPPNTYPSNTYPPNTYPPNTYPSNTNREQNSTKKVNRAHKSRSRLSLQQNLEHEGQDPRVMYPLPSLLEEIAIWERVVPTSVTNTEPCLLPAEHRDVVVAQSAMGRPVKKTIDNGSGQSGCDGCSDACSQDSELRCQFNNNDDNRLKLDSMICFSDHNKAGSDCSIMVEQKRVPHTCFDNFGNLHRLSNCCLSKTGNALLQETAPCCRKDNNPEFISVSEEASDVFFDALDSFPAGSQPRPSYNQQNHAAGLTTPARDRKRAVKFVETSAKETYGVDLSGNKSRERYITREWKGNKKVSDERTHSDKREKRRQQNIAFRFAVPRPTDATKDTFQHSVIKLPDRKRRHKHLHPADGKDLVGHLATDPHGQIVPTKISLCGQTELKTRTKKSHPSNNSARSQVDVEGAGYVQYRSAPSYTDCCSGKDQQSAAEDFYSIQEN